MAKKMYNTHHEEQEEQLEKVFTAMLDACEMSKENGVSPENIVLAALRFTVDRAFEIAPEETERGTLLVLAELQYRLETITGAVGYTPEMRRGIQPLTDTVDRAFEADPSSEQGTILVLAARLETIIDAEGDE